MVLTWLELADAGSPPPCAVFADLLRYSKRKTFAAQPTVGPDGALVVTPAVFKPRKKLAAADDEGRPTPARPAPRAKPKAPRKAAAPSETPAFTLPGAVSILHNAQQQSEQVITDDDNDDEEVADYFEIMEDLTRRFDCDAVRRKIQSFLARKTMTQAAFLKEIRTNANSFRKFMSYKGRDKGCENNTYQGALLFFYRQEQEEEDDSTTGDGQSASNKGPKMSRKEQSLKAQSFFDKINAVALPEPVYVYDDCDDIRGKLHELIESKTVTQAALLKHLDVNSNSLRRFLTTKGKREGCSTNVYRLAYMMFEKLRIAEGKPKTRKRLQNEQKLPEGYSLKRDPTHYNVLADEF